MPNGNQILLQLKADNKQLSAKLKQSEQKVKGLEKQVQSSSAKMKNSFEGLKAGFLVFAGGLFLAKRAIDKILSVTEKQVRAEAQLNAVLKSTKNAAGLTAEEVKNMASELQGVTDFGDETTIMGQNLLLTFTSIGKEVFPRATESMLDMSAAMGTDLKSSAILIGKALNDPIKGLSALSRVGVKLSDENINLVKSFSKVGDIASAQKVILSELETQFGGTARAISKAGDGSIRFSNAVGDVIENIGKELIPVLRSSSDELVENAAYWKEWGTRVGQVIASVIKTLQLLGRASLRTMDIMVTASTLGLNKLSKVFTEDKSIGEIAKEELNNVKTFAGDIQKDVNQIYNIWNKKDTESADVFVKNQKKRRKEKEKTDKAGGGTAPPKRDKAAFLKFIGENTEAELEAERIKYEKLREMYKGHLEEQKKIDDAYETRKAHISVKGFTRSADKALGITSGLVGQMQQIHAQGFQNRMMNLELENSRRLESLQTTYNAEVEAINNSTLNEEQKKEALAKADAKYERSRKKLEAEAIYRTAQIQYEQAKSGKKLSIISAIINTAMAVTRALATVGGPAGFVLAGLVGALGAKQVQLIKDQPLPEKPKPPSRREGIVPNFQSGYVPEDHSLAYIGSREAVINAESTRANAGLLNAINESRGESVGTGITLAPVFNGNVMDQDFVDNSVMPRMRELAKSIGGQAFYRQGVYK